MEAGRHAAFIWSAYGVAAVIGLAMIVRAAIDHAVQVRALRRLRRDERP